MTDFDFSPPQHGDRLTPSEEGQDMLNILSGYKREAENNRSGGANDRDSKWKENWDLYWNRYDFSEKAAWQSQRVMPEVPAFVDRFAAAVKEAAWSSYDSLYTVEDVSDPNNTLAPSVKAMTDYWLSRCGEMSHGRPAPFTTVIEEQAKLGAISACCSSVTWEKDVPGGRVAVKTVDPRNVWLDHTGRHLYRIRQLVVDRHELAKMGSMKDRRGNAIFNREELDRLQGSMKHDIQANASIASGYGSEVTSTRQPVVLDEYLATVVNSDGEVLADQELIVVANDRFIVRGPEKNPYWHNEDWLVYAPLVSSPLSVYGRSYMEDFGSVAQVFTELTNLILDAVLVSSLNAMAVVPEMLTNPDQLTEGVWPLKMFELEEGVDPRLFATPIELGTLDPSAVQVWQALKGELAEAAGVNEVGLGQFAPNSRTSATEIAATQRSSSALVRSVVQTMEMRYLDPVLDLVWKTGLQHASSRDDALRRVIGEDMFDQIMAERRTLIQRPFTLQARGISSLVERGQKLQQLLQALQIVAMNETIAAAFVQRVDFEKLLNLLLELSNIDMTRISKSQRQEMIERVVQPLQARAEQGGSNPSGPGAAAGGQLAAGLGVAQ